MITQMTVLLKVKELKQDQAFRELQRRREALAAAEDRRFAADAALAESRRTLEAREDAIYSGILGQVVGLDDLDATKGRVAGLLREHGALEDGRERSVHVEARVRSEADEQGAVYRAAARVRDKYVILTDEMRAVREAERALAEENEIEELFTRPRRAPGSAPGRTVKREVGR